MSEGPGWFSRFWKNMHRPRSYQRALRVVLVAFLASLLRLAASGATPVDVDMKVDQVAAMPATTAHARLISKLIKATWAHSIEQSTEIPYGTVVVDLSVDRQGKVFGLRIVSGPPKEILHRLALNAVNGTQLPAMPNDVIKELQGKRLPLDITFKCVPPPDPVRKSSRH